MLANLPNTLILEGTYVRLEPLDESHLVDLAQASLNGELWKLHFTTVPHPDDLSAWYQAALVERASNQQRPFAVRNLRTGQVVGSTRYYDIEPEHRNLSIGYTWYAGSTQRTAINSEAKLLLLQHAFEECGCVAVYWHTHPENVRSQAAIERLGAQKDEVIRNHKIMPDGALRDTVCYSMIDSEWAENKQNLLNKLAAY